MDKRIATILKNKNNRIILIILIIGIFLLLIPQKSTQKRENVEEVATGTNDEERLAAILSEMRGVKNAEVMITYSSTEEKRLAYETKSERTDKGTAGYEEGINEEAIMANGEPVVLSKSYPKVKGVVVIAEGVSVSEVRADVLEAVTTAFDISPNKVCILEK